MENCSVFIDGTVQAVVQQSVLYNGYKRVHSIKYQANGAPNRLCAHLSGPLEDRKHDTSMLYESGLLQNFAAELS